MTKSFHCQPTYSVLIADDSMPDRALMRETLRNQERLKLVGEACDGEEAISYLSRAKSEPTSTTNPVPDLLLLDLRMPNKSGYDVLEWVQKENGFDHMLVVVLAGSNLPEDFERCMQLGADAYYVKMPQREARYEMMRSIEKLLLLSRQDASSSLATK